MIYEAKKEELEAMLSLSASEFEDSYNSSSKAYKIVSHGLDGLNLNQVLAVITRVFHSVTKEIPGQDPFEKVLKYNIEILQHWTCLLEISLKDEEKEKENEKSN